MVFVALEFEFTEFTSFELFIMKFWVLFLPPWTRCEKFPKLLLRGMFALTKFYRAESISEECFLEKVNSQNQFPLIIKPAEGSSSIGVQEVIDLEELQFFYKRTRDPIVQSKAVGDEYTVNFYVDRNKTCRVAVPHRRLETRAGEVSKCITCHVPELEKFAALLASKLPDAFGPMCYQAFCSDDGRIEVIEINARFGGGYPVAHFAGANFIKCLLQEMHHEGLSDEALNWTPGTAMLRWDDAVFTTAEDIFTN